MRAVYTTCMEAFRADDVYRRRRWWCLDIAGYKPDQFQKIRNKKPSIRWLICYVCAPWNLVSTFRRATEGLGRACNYVQGGTARERLWRMLCT